MDDTTGNKQGCEVFFLQIGKNDPKDKEGGQSGDAIVLTMGNRFSNNRNDYKIVVVDGAFTNDAESIKEHLDVIGARNEDGKLQIDLMVSTHSDQDHISGLIALIEDDKVEVEELWVHDCSKVDGVVQCNVEQAENLIGIAKRKGIPMYEPFSDVGSSYDPDGIDACIEILGPTKDYYADLMTAEEKEEIPGKRKSAMFAWGKEQYYKLTTVLDDIFDFEFLLDPDKNDTSNSNNSSTVLLLKFFQGGVVRDLVLLTADAGVDALERILPDLEYHGWHDKDVHRFVQVPHHGSRRNVGPTFLTKILGEKDRGCKRGECCVSAHEKDESHPKVQVLNAFTRRGYKHVSNEGRHVLHSIGYTPDILGWSPVEPTGLLPGEEAENHD